MPENKVVPDDQLLVGISGISWSSLDSTFDKWLPVAALVLQYTVPEYTDFIYGKTIQTNKGGEPAMYFTIYSRGF